jgi:FkbM family methyltransferase
MIRGVPVDVPEVFCFRHGFKRFPSSVIKWVKNRDILDIGAYDGASALVLSEYGRAVYSFEISKPNLKRAERVLAHNPNFSRNVHLIPFGVSSKSGTVAVQGAGEGAFIAKNGKEQIAIVSVDDFSIMHNLTIGFMKADIEGHGFAMITGSRQTLLRDRPVFSISIYHDFVEMFNLTEFVMDLLPNYHFELHMDRSDVAWAFFHLSIVGWPLEAEE